MGLENAKQTPLFPAYKDSGKIVDFAGWALPVTFKGVNAEHLAVRELAGMFDTSHMGEVRVKGPDAFSLCAENFLQRPIENHGRQGPIWGTLEPKRRDY